MRLVGRRSGTKQGMRLRNDVRDYGPVSKVLHWLTAAAVAGQFAVGWIMEPEDAALDRETDRIDQLEEQGEEQAERQGEAAEERFENEIDRLEDELNAREDNYVADAFSGMWSRDALNDGLSLPEVHVLLGLSIVVLGLLRVIWRAAAGLPPWADHLGQGERRLEAWLEKLLLALLIAAGHDWLPLHVTAQVVFLAVIALHVGLVLKHTIVRPNRHLARML